ncbi:hypothetical protein CYMTET_20114 [Cymbomonas tetramitiformis]|uniref:Uncharacterized protein n=1 Tax=Cymbomonas tetramitiformis TaxID=36881 RepID=A0AAE0G5C8_9CHLO|nr:hypothetical protein CYMTET_20114 [Cymbomonas tetramitiformis]
MPGRFGATEPAFYGGTSHSSFEAFETYKRWKGHQRKSGQTIVQAEPTTSASSTSAFVPDVAKVELADTPLKRTRTLARSCTYRSTEAEVASPAVAAPSSISPGGDESQALLTTEGRKTPSSWITCGDVKPPDGEHAYESGLPALQSVLSTPLHLLRPNGSRHCGNLPSKDTQKRRQYPSIVTVTTGRPKSSPHRSRSGVSRASEPNTEKGEWILEESKTQTQLQKAQLRSKSTPSRVYRGLVLEHRRPALQQQNGEGLFRMFEDLCHAGRHTQHQEGITQDTLDHILHKQIAVAQPVTVGARRVPLDPLEEDKMAVAEAFEKLTANLSKTLESEEHTYASTKQRERRLDRAPIMHVPASKAPAVGATAARVSSVRAELLADSHTFQEGFVQRQMSIRT